MSVWDPPSPPAITSAATASGVAGTALQYSITATNSPKVYAANGVPPGMFLDPQNGKIYGIPASPGIYTVTIAAMNLGGAGAGLVTITVT